KDQDFLKKIGWEGRTVILTVSRLQKRKGHDQMIPGLVKIRKQVPDILYAIVGDGAERAHLERLVRDYDLSSVVQFLGEFGMDDDRLIKCYQQCDLFVLPNREVDNDIEGFGMVLIEAQACGIPVIGGICGGTAETMRIPDTGLVVDCTGPEKLADLVCELLIDRPRLTRMGTEAREWVAENFDWDTLSKSAYGVFSDLMRTEKRDTGLGALQPQDDILVESKHQ